MPFKWKQEQVAADIDALMGTLESDTPPPPKENNQLTLTMTMGGKVHFESEAPAELEFTMQIAHAITAMVVGGQLDDVRNTLDKLIEITKPFEFIEILIRVVASQTEFMDLMLDAGVGAAKLAGITGADRPVFTVSNFPPPNRPVLNKLDDLGADDEEEAKAHDPTDAGAARPGENPAGPAPEEQRGPGDAGQDTGATDLHEPHG